MSTLPTWTIQSRHNVKADDGTQMTPCPCAWFKFAFSPFSTTHKGNYVLLLAKVLDQPIHHFTFLCNKQISREESSFNGINYKLRDVTFASYEKIL
jgi:hypothetical protein